jgi:acetolactate synthase-1/2/3 large subunit
MRLSDYIFSELRQWSARHVFLITGGGAMHPMTQLEPAGSTTSAHNHEQAAAMAAEGYARITRGPAVRN